MMTTASKEINVVDIKDDDDSINEDQLSEYDEMLEELGSFPDKVKINSLTWIAEDYADSESSSGAIYRIIRQRLLTSSRDNILPVVYVIDSILKNVKGFYLSIIENDATEWMSNVFRKLHDPQRMKLEKVWRTWNEFKLFPVDSWKSIGSCFVDNTSISNVPSPAAILESAGITRTKDGTLILPGNLRKEMQSILDEVYNGMQNELEKVSLERLADIDPGVLVNIKGAAEEAMRSSRGQTDLRQQAKLSNTVDDVQLPSFFTETRSPECMRISKEWQQLKTWKPIEQTQELITKLNTIVEEGGAADSVKLYTREEALQMTQYFAVASITASFLQAGFTSICTTSTPNVKPSAVRSQRVNPVSVTGGSFAVDKTDFTNEGIKKKNEAVVGLLYEIGLPYVSSADGRRFNSHIELSHHLDALFKRSQLEKSMARTEERGWYRFDQNWILRISEEETSVPGSYGDGTIDMDSDIVENNEISTVAADESRDRCVICGLKFKMHFDHDDGIYKYSNCKEVEVMNDDAAETESDMKLVHFTCWKGLGSPDVLTFDQTLQDELQ